MKRIGIISDTHGYLDKGFVEHLQGCDEIWHAGDIGDIKVARQLQQLAVLKAVYGNIDGYDIRAVFPEINRFNCEGVDVAIKHIVGYPGNYDYSIRNYIEQNPPKLLIAGHSHILKIQNDQQHGFLLINPGAAGRNGFHQVKTIVKLQIDNEKISDCQVVEIKR